MSNKMVAAVIAFLIFLIIAFSFVFTVYEGQEALILRLGKIVQNTQTGLPQVYKPGLHIKWPVIESLRMFDVRLQTLEAQSSRILTAEQKYVIVDYYAKWRIDNLALYFTRTSSNEDLAQRLIRQKLNDSLRAEFGKKTINQVVAGGRGDIMQSLRSEANDNVKSLGVKVIDVRIKRIDLPPEVSASVFQRMSAQREQVAAKHRADGQAAAEKLRAEADAEAKVIVAIARAESAKIRANGDEQAAKVYSKAYTRDRSFYAFLRSINAYVKTFNHKQDFLVLSPDSQFFKFFNGVAGAKTDKVKSSG